MDQVDRADIEACRNADPAAERDHPFGEIEARAPVIETAVDMRRLDVEEGGRVDRFGEALKEAHGEGGALPMRAVQEFAIERGEVGSHSRARLPAAGRGGQCARTAGLCYARSGGVPERSMSLVAIGARLRAICLALPEANEEPMRRGPSYRVADKIFALERPWNDWLALWCKAPKGSRDFILDAEPARFFIPPYFGARGWIGVGLDEAADWREIEAFVQRSYRLVAPKRLGKLMA